MLASLPNHLLVLLLTDVVGDLAINLTGLQSHGERFCHIGLY